MKSIFYVLILMLSLCLPTFLGATTYMCTVCDEDDVQSLINNASNGDTIKIPAGNYIWQGGVNMTGKEITIIGDGVGKTTITDDASGNNYLFYSTGSNWRISHMTIKNGSVNKGIIWLDGSYNTGWRIDNIYFDEMSGRAIWIGREDDGENYGLIDNCTFYDSSGAPAIIQVFGNAEGGWDHDLRLGSQYAVYVEDCVFDLSNSSSYSDGNPAIDCVDGGEIVFRYNTLYDISVGIHDACSGTSVTPRACRKWEFYNNELNFDLASKNDTDLWMAFDMRGGTGIIFNNDVYIEPGTGFQYIIGLQNYRSCQGDRITECSIYGYDRCDGDSKWDTNFDHTGWLCLDQIGATADGPDAGSEQDSEPAYEYNNRYTTDRGKIWKDADYVVRTGLCDLMLEHIKENRDFYNDTLKPGYTPYQYPHPLNTTSALRSANSGGGGGGSSCFLKSIFWQREN